MPIPTTLLTSLSLEGRGLHTGALSHVTLHPSPPGHGRVFRREGVTIPALWDFVTETRRSTTLGRDGVTISTVEHLLAALMLAGIDNVTIDIDGPELPALDGSAQQWYTALTEAGVCPQHGELSMLSITEPRWFAVEASQFLLVPAPDLALYAGITIPDTPVDHVMAGGALDDAGIREQIVRARTYGLQWEVEALLQAGLARGGSLENAVILTHDGYLNAAVWPQEPAWHKVLDLLGDLALVGTRLTGHIIALHAGHRSHVELVRYLRQEFHTSSRIV